MSDGVEIQCGPADRDGKRTVIASLGRRQHVGKFDVQSEYHRRVFRENVVKKFKLPDDAHEWIEQTIIDAAADEDQRPQVEAMATPLLVSLAAMTAKPVHWFWDYYIPKGAITLLYGDPNEGKSQIAVNIVARWSRGLSMPPQETPTGGAAGCALIMSAEDDLERTTLPRLIAAGGDPQRVHHLREVTAWDSSHPRLVQLPNDVPMIEAVVKEHRIGLIVVDVFSAFIAEGLNQNSDSDMRHCLSPLSAMAERTQAAVLLLAHMNKKEGTRSMYRGGGSIAIVGAARAAFAVAPHPDDPTEKVFAAVKHNLGPRPASLTYRIEPAGAVSRIAWGGLTELTAADVLKTQTTGGAGGHKLEQAKAIIVGVLATGPRGSNEVEAACTDAGLSKSTYWNARRALGVEAEKTAFNGNWLLTLPRANGAF